MPLPGTDGRWTRELRSSLAGASAPQAKPTRRSRPHLRTDSARMGASAYGSVGLRLARALAIGSRLSPSCGLWRGGSAGLGLFRRSNGSDSTQEARPSDRPGLGLRDLPRSQRVLDSAYPNGRHVPSEPTTTPSTCGGRAEVEACPHLSITRRTAPPSPVPGLHRNCGSARARRPCAIH